MPYKNNPKTIVVIDHDNWIITLIKNGLSTNNAETDVKILNDIIQQFSYHSDVEIYSYMGTRSPHYLKYETAQLVRGFNIIPVPAVPVGDNFKSPADVWIAKDITRFSLLRKNDIGEIILLTSDCDFYPIFGDLKSEGILSGIIAPQHVSNVLLSKPDHVMYPNQFKRNWLATAEKYGHKLSISPETPIIKSDLDNSVKIESRNNSPQPVSVASPSKNQIKELKEYINGFISGEKKIDIAVVGGRISKQWPLKDLYKGFKQKNLKSLLSSLGYKVQANKSKTKVELININFVPNKEEPKQPVLAEVIPIKPVKEPLADKKVKKSVQEVAVQEVPEELFLSEKDFITNDLDSEVTPIEELQFDERINCKRTSRRQAKLALKKMYLDYDCLEAC